MLQWYSPRNANLREREGIAVCPINEHEPFWCESPSQEAGQYLEFIQEVYPWILSALSLLETLRQDTIWKTQHEGIKKLDEMAESHKHNLIKWLDKRAQLIHIAGIVDIEYDEMKHNGGEMAHLSIEEIRAEIEGMDPMEFLRELPLYQALGG